MGVFDPLVNLIKLNVLKQCRIYGVMVNTWDFESHDPSSNLGRSYNFIGVQMNEIKHI